MTNSASDFDHLRTSRRGTLLRPGDVGFNAARNVWNGMIDKQPAAIVRCAGTADVMRSVAFTRDAGLPLAIRGGGHNVAGNATCDGGIVIDLGLIAGVAVETLRRSWPLAVS